MPTLDEILMGEQPDTRPATPADAQIGQAMTPPAVQTDPGTTGPQPTGDARTLTATSSTFKPLVAGNPDDKDSVEIVNLANQYLSSGKSFDDLPPDIAYRTMRAVNDHPAIP